MVFADERLEVRSSFRPGPQARLAPDEVDRAMVHEGQEERPERPAGRVVRLGGAPEREEGVVHDVLRQDLLAGDANGETVRRARVAVIELVERGAISRGQAAVELEVLAVAVSHGPYPPSRCGTSSCIRVPAVICATRRAV
jgi:hypothetical protein